MYSYAEETKKQMSYTFDEYTVSDLHKDAFGFRPSQCWWDSWTTMTDDEKQSEWDSLIESMEASCVEEASREQRAVAIFENTVSAVLASGAKDRATAHRWLMEASKAQGDWEYFCFLNGLPYGYFKEVA